MWYLLTTVRTEEAQAHFIPTHICHFVVIASALQAHGDPEPQRQILDCRVGSVEPLRNDDGDSAAF